MSDIELPPAAMMLELLTGSLLVALAPVLALVAAVRFPVP